MIAGVVVPAHNEQQRLSACLDALGDTMVVVVADACTDRTAEIARDRGAIVLELARRNVGAARAVGVRELLRRGVTWVATTDADTLVPPGWLTTQLRMAARGWDAIVGTVTVSDWSDHPPWRPAVYSRHYLTDLPVHGANLGFTADSYLAAGGFPSVCTGEDRALVVALERTGHKILRTSRLTVTTSARRHYRAPGGFGHLLTTLNEGSATSRPSRPQPD